VSQIRGHQGIRPPAPLPLPLQQHRPGIPARRLALPTPPIISETRDNSCLNTSPHDSPSINQLPQGTKSHYPPHPSSMIKPTSAGGGRGSHSRVPSAAMSSSLRSIHASFCRPTASKSTWMTPRNPPRPNRHHPLPQTVQQRAPHGANPRRSAHTGTPPSFPKTLSQTPDYLIAPKRWPREPPLPARPRQSEDRRVQARTQHDHIRPGPSLPVP
jgi:hypothetical protein